jgi:catechol-2,3-dioxygenase
LFVKITELSNTLTKKTIHMEDSKDKTENTDSPNDSTPKVTGIGGIFFFSDNPDKTKEWYAENLGLEVNQWGSSFEFRNANRPEEVNYLQWSPFKSGSDYFHHPKRIL